MTASPFLRRRRSKLAFWIRLLGLVYIIPASVAPYLFDLGRSLGYIRPTFQGYGLARRDEHHGTVVLYTGVILGVLLLAFAKWIVAFFLPSYAPPFEARAVSGQHASDSNPVLWMRMMTDARRPWRLLLVGSVLLALAVEPILILAIVLLEPLLPGPRVTTSGLTVAYAYVLVLPGLLALLWGGRLWWEAYSDRRDLRRQLSMRP